MVVDENPVYRNRTDVTDRHSGRVILITLPAIGFPIESVELINSIVNSKITNFSLSTYSQTYMRIPLIYEKLNRFRLKHE